MRGKNAQRVYLIFGVGLALVMALSLFAPALTSTTTTDPAVIEPTGTVPPTAPPPITDFSGISFTEEEYLHPSGLFTVSVPTGWQPSTPANSGIQAQTSLNNASALSVIETSLQQPTPMPTTLDELSNVYTRGFLSGSWSRYSSWEELARRQDTENNRLLIDFQLTRQGQTFLARQASWFDDEYVYLVRVVVTDNMIDLMNFMLDEMVDEIRVNGQFSGTPLGWNGYFDQAAQHIIRYPQTWFISDQAAGGPVSIESGDGTRLRVEAATEGSIEDEAAASAYVEMLLPGIEVLSVAPVERPSTTGGFAVAYSLPDPDGVPQSGLAVLLNDDEGQLHVASGLVRGVDVDFNDPDAAMTDDDADPEATAEAEAAPVTVNPMITDFATVMGTFSRLTGLNLPEPEPEPTPTPVVEVTPEATAEAEATPEATVEAEATEEVEVTPESTSEAETAPEATE